MTHHAAKGFDATFPYNATENTVDKYRISVDEPILGVGSEFARYYRGSSLDGQQLCQVIVFEESFPLNRQMVAAIHKDNAGFRKVLAYGITKLAPIGRWHACVVLDEHCWQSLAEMLDSGQVLSAHFITVHLIPFLLKMLQWAEQKRMFYGNLTPENILIDGEELALREPFVDIPYRRHATEELPMENASCSPYTRFNANMASEIFCAGLVTFQALTGLLNITDIDAYRKARAKLGTYGALHVSLTAPEEARAFLKGALQDNIDERWTLVQIEEWLEGKGVFNRQTYEDFTQVGFNGEVYTTFHGLADAMSQDWGTAVAFVKEARFAKWVKRNADKNHRLALLDGYLTSELHQLDNDDRLARVLSILDPYGPLRHGAFCAHPSSACYIIFDGALKGKHDQIDAMMRLVARGIFREHVRHGTPTARHDASVLDRLARLYNPKLQGFGIERLLYATHLSLPCLSPLLHEYRAFEIQDVMLGLDDIALKYPDKFFIDRHIASFLLQTLELKQEARVRGLYNLPGVKENVILSDIAILALVCEKHSVKMPHLTQLVCKELTQILQLNLLNIKKRNEIIEKINTTAQSGLLAQVIDVVGNANVYNADKVGYRRALKEIEDLERQISLLLNEGYSARMGIMVGQKATVMLSYALFTIAFAVLVM